MQDEEEANAMKKTPHVSTAAGAVRTLAVAAGLLVAVGCGAPPAEAPTGEPGAGMPTAADATADAAAAGTGAPTLDIAAVATGDTVVVDHVSMADMPCHAMGNVIMGQCAPDDIERIVGELEILPYDAQAMADQPCHVMDSTIMGQCSAEDIARLRRESTILVDTGLMADMPCHVMGNTIMGACGTDDVERLRAEMRDAR